MGHQLAHPSVIIENGAGFSWWSPSRTAAAKNSPASHPTTGRLTGTGSCRRMADVDAWMASWNEPSP